jgi:hypothetical protein
MDAYRIKQPFSYRRTPNKNRTGNKVEHGQANHYIIINYK